MTYGSESECTTHYTTAPHIRVVQGLILVEHLDEGGFILVCLLSHFISKRHIHQSEIIRIGRKFELI